MRVSNFQRWSGGLSTKGINVEHRPNDAATRLTSAGVVEVYNESKFKLDRNAKVFCIGSCFAREIEIALNEENISVLSNDLEMNNYGVVPQHFPNHGSPPVGIFTKFNSFSMAQEVERVVQKKTASENDFVQINDQHWDAALHQVPYSDLDTALKIRRMVDGTFKKLANANIIILTLGLTEMWWDCDTDLALNDTPRDFRLLRETNRFEFRNASYDQVYNNINHIIHLLEKINPDLKIIVTVSPVPLHRTFTNNDIIIANSYSKSLLRAVSERISQENANVDYFPSYEIVINTSREIAWESDHRHVKPWLVKHIMDKFISEYLECR
jgi:hypothetical protein